MLEVMVATAMLVTVATVIMGSFSQSFRVRDHSHKIFERYGDVRMAMHRMAREISMAYLSKHHAPSEPNTASWFEGDDDELHFLSFANLRMVRDADHSDQAEIGYFTERGETSNGERAENLYRRIDATPDDEPLKGGVKYLMVENVKRIEFEYWDQTKEVDDDAWVDEWEAGIQKNETGEKEFVLPARVRITLTVKGVSGKDLKFVTQSQIMVTEALDF